MAIAILNPIPQFWDLDGSPLDEGYMYFGVATANPITFPATVYWDAAQTIVAAQPIRTLNGFPMRSGSPAIIYSDADRSLLVQNKRRQQVFYGPNSADFGNASTLLTLITQRVDDVLERLADDSDAANGAGMVESNYALIYPVRSLGLANYGRPPATWAMSDAQVADVAANTASLDVTTALNTILDTGYPVDFMPGTYGIGAPLTPTTQQTLSGSKREKSIIKARAGFAGSAMVSFPSGAWSGVTIQNLKINADNIAARCLEMIGSTQGAVDQIILRDVALSLATARPFHLENVTYFELDHLLWNGGSDGGRMVECYTGSARNCVGYHGATAALILEEGADCTFYDQVLFNNSGTTSTSLLLIDGGHGHVFYRLTTEPQGAANVVQEVLIVDTSGAGNCADNRLIDCNSLGVANTKTNSVVVGILGGTPIYKTGIVRHKSIKPTGNDSIVLNAQESTDISGCCDLVTYDTGTYAPITIENNSGNVFQREGETVGTFTVAIEGATTNPTITSGTITGNWMRQGRQTFFSFNTGAVTWSAAGTGGFRFTITGLDMTGGTNVPIQISNCTLFSNAACATIISATQIALYPVGSNTSLNWAAPPVSGGQAIISGSFVASA